MSYFLSALFAFSGAVYVDGYGWVDRRAVSHCLLEIGAPHVDVLHDAQWEEFTDCLTNNS